MRVLERQVHRIACPMMLDAEAPADKQASCIGSRCMAWRWTKHEYLVDDGEGEHPERLGFCGMSGPYGDKG